jgi:hypothetical protein
MVYEQGAFDGVVVVHPAAAMNLAGQFLVGVFENINRARLAKGLCLRLRNCTFTI